MEFYTIPKFENVCFSTILCGPLFCQRGFQFLCCIIKMNRCIIYHTVHIVMLGIAGIHSIHSCVFGLHSNHDIFF